MGSAHTHSVLLGGEKGFEDAIGIFEADAAILHFDAEDAGILHPGAQGQGSPAFGDRSQHVAVIRFRPA